MAVFKNVHHLRHFCKNTTDSFTDKRLQDFFFRRTYRAWFNDSTQYVYYFLSYVTTGVTVAVVAHELMGNPSIAIRGRNTSQLLPDRLSLHAHAIPFYNHTLRNYSQKFTASLVDNEHDYGQEDPYKYRPKREKHYGRFPFIFSAPRYFIDCPEYENTLHKNVEKRYVELGYYGSSE
ncbi:hypothetical protein BEWA_001420 [Theileria equi strain WA]|uniref:Uncharacterized protein n=1 Tax=Theileria equi strain WA TaxID=1537102 RepID=L0AYU0_THEEQ|nr:hypothetical protein BEWA_001420 [Theileria equi strain WA]AFZ80735.1 hypothetical protein BEWA_001420 [Theileria equi strain WA]|eukprot:XP_004830401.1 hypothetical protein BEWA_001420 [Theileria equi strain WA]